MSDRNVFGKPRKDDMIFNGRRLLTVKKELGGLGASLVVSCQLGCKHYFDLGDWARLEHEGYYPVLPEDAPHLPRPDAPKVKLAPRPGPRPSPEWERDRLERKEREEQAAALDRIVRCEEIRQHVTPRVPSDEVAHRITGARGIVTEVVEEGTFASVVWANGQEEVVPLALLGDYLPVDWVALGKVALALSLILTFGFLVTSWALL